MNISSDHLNYLVYRYLLESGFTHAQFAFQQEASIPSLNINQASVQPGYLISLLQKGLSYIELETHTQDDGITRKCLIPFDLISSHECVNIDPEKEEDRPLKKPKKDSYDMNKKSIQESTTNFSTSVIASTIKKVNQSNPSTVEKVKKQRKISTQDNHQVPTPTFVPSTPNQNEDMDLDTIGSLIDADLMKSPLVLKKSPKLLLPTTTNYALHGHTGDLYIGKWSSKNDSLAVGSSDAIARIWILNETENGLDSKSIPLSHADDIPVSGDNKEVACLDWHPEGEFLATGSYSGICKIWTKEGELKFTLSKHRAAISCLAWNQSGDILVTGSEDNTAIAWDSVTGDMRQIFDFHFAPVLDIDWKDDITFATCSHDKTIYVCQLGSPVPLKDFVGHESDINTVRWDHSGTYCASSSDDNTAKIWVMESSTCKWNLTGHTEVIVTLIWFQSKWTKTPVLITGSHDTKIKFWDPKTGECMRTFDQHTDAIHSLTISPDHKYIASGASDMCVCVWSAQDGKLVETYKVDSKIYHIQFSWDGKKISVCGIDDHVPFCHQYFTNNQ